MITLILTDDHAMLREGLRSEFAATGAFNVIGEAGSAAELKALLKTKKPQVIVMDVKLPDGNGISVMQQLKAAYPDCRFVVLTMYDHVRYAIHALESGASGFVVKGAPFEELQEAVKRASQDQTFVSATIAPKLADRLRHKERASGLDDLSPREFEVFVHLSSGITVKQTGLQMGISEKTVTTYRARLMEKLSLSNKADLIRLALEAGLLE